jgi:serine/threonine protein kinase
MGIENCCAKPKEAANATAGTTVKKKLPSINLMDVSSLVQLEDFKILKMIGRGGFGKVYLVKQQGTQNHYAMKVLQKDYIIQND